MAMVGLLEGGGASCRVRVRVRAREGEDGGGDEGTSSHVLFCFVLNFYK